MHDTAIIMGVTGSMSPRYCLLLDTDQMLEMPEIEMNQTFGTLQQHWCAEYSNGSKSWNMFVCRSSSKLDCAAIQTLPQCLATIHESACTFRSVI